MRSLAQILVKYKHDGMGVFTYDTDQGGNLLHLAVQYSPLCLEQILPHVFDQINGKDINGMKFF